MANTVFFLADSSWSFGPKADWHDDAVRSAGGVTIPANPIACSDGFRSPVPVIPIAHRSEATVNGG
jgi:hypothetical protein